MKLLCREKKLQLLALSILLLLVLAIFAPGVQIGEHAGSVKYKEAHAQLQTFGGMVFPITYCTCSNNWLVVIGPPVNGTFVYTMGTQGYNRFNMPWGTWALGFYSPPGICLMYIGYGCTTIGSPQGFITNTVGSSI